MGPKWPLYPRSIHAELMLSVRLHGYQCARWCTAPSSPSWALPLKQYHWVLLNLPLCVVPESHPNQQLGSVEDEVDFFDVAVSVVTHASAYDLGGVLLVPRCHLYTCLVTCRTRMPMPICMSICVPARMPMHMPYMHTQLLCRYGCGTCRHGLFGCAL